ncbi:hypothetical protein HPB47_013048 [Ixodes persulcatus]|uniref:Uncharacterized protein n=1 Tax=Ixodes persulcatus TaxID=34615 RepID=A0AC60NRW2_IXOPE|nr:hypothetical protein HPB47_013048 [Ixodes persulcatus]
MRRTLGVIRRRAEFSLGTRLAGRRQRQAARAWRGSSGAVPTHLVTSEGAAISVRRSLRPDAEGLRLRPAAPMAPTGARGAAHLVPRGRATGPNSEGEAEKTRRILGTDGGDKKIAKE